MPRDLARAALGEPPSPDGGWSTEIVALENAIVVPPVASGTVQACGVLHADGGFCAQSATWRNMRPMMTAPEPPTQVPQNLAGRHLFAGQLWSHFGHFIAESMSRLWALDHIKNDLDSIVFIPKRPGQKHALKGYQKEFLSLLGIDIPIRILDENTQVEELIVPGQGFGLGEISRGTDEFRAFFAQNFARDIAAEGARNIYLSRSKLGGLEGSIVLEEVLEANLERAGYTTYHPQQHSIRDQVAQYRAAQKIVGPDGSAFHLFGFVGQPSQKVAIVLRRNSNVFNGLRTHIQAFSGIDPTLISVVASDWIPQHKKRPGRYSFGQLDFDALGAGLAETGFIDSQKDWQVPRFREFTQNMLEFSQKKGLTYNRVKKPGPTGQAPMSRTTGGAA